MQPMHAYTLCILSCVWHVHCMRAQVVFQSLDANSDKVIDEAEFVKFFGPAVDETAAAAAELTTTAELEQAKLLK